MRYASRGFTIVELLIVIIVIAILATVTVSAFNGVKERSRLNSAASFARQMERVYGQNKLVNFTFEDGLGNGNSPRPTENSGSNLSWVMDGVQSTAMRTIASSELPNNQYVYDYSQTNNGQAQMRLYPSNYPTGSYVMSYWFKHRSDITNWDGHVLTCFDCGTGTQNGWSAGSGPTGYRVDYSPRFGGPAISLRSKPYDLSKWHHFALQYDQDTGRIKLFIDGVKEDDQPTLSVTYSSVYMDVGRGVGGNMMGQIDDIKLYGYN